jgi:hypothetical protein
LSDKKEHIREDLAGLDEDEGEIVIDEEELE